jgi:hypothetical protein
VWQVVICKDEIGTDRASRHQFERGNLVRRRYSVMALVPEKVLEKFAPFGIVLDD